MRISFHGRKHSPYRKPDKVWSTGTVAQRFIFQPSHETARTVEHVLIISRSIPQRKPRRALYAWCHVIMQFSPFATRRWPLIITVQTEIPDTLAAKSDNHETPKVREHEKSQNSVNRLRPADRLRFVVSFFRDFVIPFLV